MGGASIPLITSTSNTKIKLVRALQTQPQKRKAENAFVAEGVRLLEDAITVKWPLEFILYDQSLSDRGKAILAALPGPIQQEVYETTPGIMAAISDTESPQGILAVLKQSALPLPNSPTFLILADQVRDPGNMGTLLRTAEAAGADAVMVSPGTVDAYAPKVIRGAMGAHFHLPIHALPWHEIHQHLKGLPVFLARTDAEGSFWDADFNQPCVLLIGGEAFGASPMGEAIATHYVAIPMAGRAESLNAAVAAGILMAEVMRQRQPQLKEN
jgi:RNA methyltransferase, TrmH family